jgi:chromosome segregation ATPase
VLSLADELEEVKAALADEQRTIKSLRENIEEVLLEKEKTEEQTKTDLESFRESLEHLKDDLDETSKVRSSLERDLSAAKARTLALEEELHVVAQTKEQSGQQVRSLTGELEQVKFAFEQEQERIQSLEENLARSTAEKEKMEELAKTDLDSYKTTFIKLKRDLDETNASCTRFERELEIARTQNKAYENELNLASQNKEQSGLQVHSLAEELEKMKTALESERNLHRAGDESLEKVLQTLGRVEQDLHQSVEERDELNDSLENERTVRVAAEEKMKAAARENEQLQRELRGITGQQDRQENALSEQITTLTRDLEQLYEIRKSLEEQVVVQNKEKSAAERKVLSLTSELEQARTALADEWEDHMTSDERLAAAEEERSRLQQAFLKKEQEKIVGKTGQALISRTSDVLPAIVKPVSHSLATVTSHDLQKQSVPEPEESPKKESEKPHDSITDESEEVPGRSEEDTISVEETGESPETVEPDHIPGDSGRTGPAGIFSFNRKEWYDLLRWAHHSKTLSHDQRMQIVRMGRLIQKDRKLTGKQEEQVGELIALVQALGYKPR